MLAPPENTPGRRGNASPTQTNEPGKSVPPGATSAEPEAGFSFGAGLKVRRAKGFHALPEWTPAAIADALGRVYADQPHAKHADLRVKRFNLNRVPIHHPQNRPQVQRTRARSVSDGCRVKLSSASNPDAHYKTVRVLY